MLIAWYCYLFWPFFLSYMIAFVHILSVSEMTEVANCVTAKYCNKNLQLIYDISQSSGYQKWQYNYSMLIQKYLETANECQNWRKRGPIFGLVKHVYNTICYQSIYLHIHIYKCRHIRTHIYLHISVFIYTYLYRVRHNYGNTHFMIVLDEKV